MNDEIVEKGSDHGGPYYSLFFLELEDLINKFSIENGSNTPDFILAEYLRSCLLAFNNAVVSREEWYGRGTTPVDLQPNNP